MRSAARRSGKYASKVSGDVLKNRLDRYRSTQVSQFSNVIGSQVAIEQKVKQLMEDMGTSPMYTNYYILLAKNLVKKQQEGRDAEYNKWWMRGMRHDSMRWIGWNINRSRLNTKAPGITGGEDPNLLGYWAFSRGTGTTALDYSGHGNHGTLKPGSGSITDETFTSNHDTPVQLAHTNLTAGTVVVTDKPSDGPYTEGVDYTIDYANGTITVLSTGGMADATDFLIDYEYSGSYPAWTDGVIGKALVFDGVDDYIEIPDNNLTDIADKMTVSLWLRTGLNHDGTFLYQSGSGIHYRIRNDGHLRALIDTEAGGSWLDYAGITDNEWHHVVVTYDGSEGRLYVDNNLADSVLLTGNLKTNANSLLIGTKLGDWYFNGMIDEICIYSRSLSAAEIKRIYDSEKPI